MFQHTAARRRLLFVAFAAIAIGDSFNTQPPEGGCSLKDFLNHPVITVSTHSRPKAAAIFDWEQEPESGEFQHTAARRRLHDPPIQQKVDVWVSTHSRPKAAAKSVKR